MFRNKNSGMSLIEAMIAIGITSILLLAISTMIDIINNNNMKQNLVATRNEVINNVRTLSINLNNIDNSAIMTNTLGATGLAVTGQSYSIPHYDMLARCNPSATSTISGCDRTDIISAPANSELKKGYKFYLSDKNSTDPLKSVAGEGVYYDMNGRRCTQTEAASAEMCPILARVWAEPFCLNFSATCNKAMSITVRYAVGGRPDYSKASIIPVLEGEVYTPLQKGIQISRVLSASNSPISANSSGIYPVVKYTGSEPINGLRFEVIIGNPTGLQTMTVQSRSLTGPSVAGLGMDSIPAALEAQSWVNLPNPGSSADVPGAGTWTINLGGAIPNQILNFGTMTTATSGNNTNVAFWIGSSNGSNTTYNWQWSGTTLTAPTFKSGFYQFRVLAEDGLGGTIESTNYVTVRVVPTPRIFQSNVFSLQRDCVTPSADFRYYVADDEALTAQALTVSGVDQTITQITGTNGYVDYTFDKSQTAGSYPINLTASNHFTGQMVQGNTILAASKPDTIVLTEVPPLFNFIDADPDKIRINNTGDILTRHQAGNCCTQTPTFSWTYPSPANVGQPMLTGPASSLATCTVSGNTRTCDTTISVNGIKDENAPSSHNALATLGLADNTDTACKITNTGNQLGIAVPVIKIPSIYFYTTGSLWLDVPPNLQSGFNKVQTPVKQVAVRIDFDPEDDVTVKIVRNGNSSDVVCNITFTAGSGFLPIDKFCTVPSNFNGTLDLFKVTSNVKIDADLDAPTFKAKIDSTKSSHAVCSAAIDDPSGQFPRDRAFTGSEILDFSPWGINLANPTVEYNESDNHSSVTWGSGPNVKDLHCYDNWSISTPTGYNGLALGTPNYNKQDAYDIIKYNRETRLLYSPYLYKNNGIRFSMADYWFPQDGGTQYNAVNVPHIFMVIQNGSPSPIAFTGVNPTGGSATTQNYAWTDQTPNYCPTVLPGSARLYSIKLTGIVGGASVYDLKAVNVAGVSGPGGSTLGTSTYYSYLFMCTYGRWNPMTRTNATWTD